VQVVNHGVEEDVVRGFRDAAAEFFAMSAEEKLPYCSDDRSKPFRLASSTTYDRDETRYWLDYLALQCHPVSQELVRHWPAEPTSFRQHLAEFSEAVHELAQMLLRLIAEGLGLKADIFAGDLSTGVTQMNVNYYPPCPDPSLTLGLLPHCDRHLLTVLSQGDVEVEGLQARHNGRWMLVRPVPDAFVVNFGHQMEIITNGVLASVEHRVITNSIATRMSVATLIMPKMECRIGPTPEMVDEATNPAKFREFVFSEFMEAYDTAAASREDVLRCFRIHKN
jgi:2'-deoxymugineic-acid 2'-dioxygenase/mugineic-acid 3-dioxygenase